MGSEMCIRDRSLVAVEFTGGVLLCAENPSRNLRKISEIYDRIGFAGVGRYNEYDQLRIAGIRHADVKGYTYSRDDVDSQALANQYAQMLGQIFTHETKPLEVEILVAAVGYERDGDRLFRIRFDGSVTDEAAALRNAVSALAGEERTLGADELEVAILDRLDDGRCFRRLENGEIAALLG